MTVNTKKRNICQLNENISSEEKKDRKRYKTGNESSVGSSRNLTAMSSLSKLFLLPGEKPVAIRGPNDGPILNGKHKQSLAATSERDITSVPRIVF